MKHSAIGIDIDGVLADFTSGFLPLLRRRCPHLALPDGYEPSSWMYLDSGATEDEVIGALRDARATAGFWRNLPAYEENVAALRNFLLHVSGVDVYYVTSRAQTADGEMSVLQQTREWLFEHGVGFPWTSVVVVPNVNWKPAVARALGLRAWVDDHLPTVLSARADTQNCYLLDRPWNRENEGRPKNLPVVNNFAEFLEMIREEVQE